MSMYVDMAMGVREGFPEEGTVLLSIGGMGRVEVF